MNINTEKYTLSSDRAAEVLQITVDYYCFGFTRIKEWTTTTGMKFLEDRLGHGGRNGWYDGAAANAREAEAYARQNIAKAIVAAAAEAVAITYKSS